MLTEEEQAALERMRGGQSFNNADARTLIDAMLRLYPPGHDAEITPERLVACGFERAGWAHGVFVHSDSITCNLFSVTEWRIMGAWIVSQLHPRNMGEVWQLLGRCGIPVEKGGEA